MRRRRILIALVVLLGVADLAFFAWRWHRDTVPNALVTYVGIDSASGWIARDEPALALTGGRWSMAGHPVPDIAALARQRKQAGRFVLIKLGSHAPYDRLVRSLRDLKARGICNVAVREGALPIDSLPSVLADKVEMPGFYLCGRPFGDVGGGQLRQDGPIHIDW